MHTQNNGYIEMSSKYDQSGTELSILPPQGLPFDVLQPTEQTATSVAPEVASTRPTTREASPARESLHTAMKTQHSQKQINKKHCLFPLFGVN